MKRLLLVALLLLPFARAATADDGPDADTRAWAHDVVAKRAASAAQAPDFPAGATWWNVSRPLSLKGALRGKVVVLDFWCFCCINCMHVLPDLQYLEETFQGKPVAVVGVHSAKFLHEQDADSVREAVLRWGIHHPVVNDPQFAIWRSYGVQAWPTFAVLGADGGLLGLLSGEGHRQELRALVEAALDWYGKKGQLDASPLPVRLERDVQPAGELSFPGKVEVDVPGGRLFVADSGHHRVLELGLDGTFRRAWGDGVPGLVDGAPDVARFRRPQGLERVGEVLWVADTENHALRRIDLATGRVSTAAGDGTQGGVRRGHGPGKTSRLSSPWDVRQVGDRLWIAMAGTHQLWTYDPATGDLAWCSGTGSELRQDAVRLDTASFAQPSGLATDGTRVWVADSESSSIVAVGPQGPVETLAGASSDPRDLFHFGNEDGRGHGRRFQHPLGVVFADGVLWVADTFNDEIKSVDPATGQVTTRWGSAVAGFSDDPPLFAEPGGIDAGGGRLWVADTNNHAIRVITLADGKVSTLPLGGVPIPSTAAKAGGVGGAWPQLAGTLARSLPGREVAASGEVTLRFRLDLPEGWHLTDGAPSVVRVEGLGGAEEQPLEDEGVTVRRPAPAAPVQVVLRMLAYVCRDAGSCRLVSRTLTLPLQPAADGPAAVEVSEAFTP
jgi:thiol-disulfide isomerase/thioredoxin